jgi:hypothetical protein
MKNKLALILVGTTLAFSNTVLTFSAQSASGLSLQSVATGLCLDSDIKKLVGIKIPVAGDVYTKPCKSNNPYQKWNLSQSDSSIILKHVKTGFCLTSRSRDGNGQRRFTGTEPCNNDEGIDKWTFTSNRTPNDNRSDGKWKNVKSGECLDSNNKGEVYAMECSDRHAGQNWGTR